MMRRVEELEWRQQTDQLTMDEERSIVEEIARIEAQLVKIGAEKEKQDRISELRRMARRLKTDASDAHQKVIELSEQSQIHHQEVVRIRPQLEEFKKSADTAHQNFVEWLKKVKDGEDSLKTVRTQIDEIVGKLRKHDTETRETHKTVQRVQQEADEKERVDTAVEKMKSGKRLTFDDFILAQRSMTDGKKRGGRKRSSPPKEPTKEEPEAKEETTDEVQEVSE
jgi:uncharacterized coiled-coil DUF342 family protein